MILLCLLGQIWNMDKTGLRSCSIKMVQQAVEYIVADKSAGRVGECGGDACCLDGLDHFSDRNRCEVSRGAALYYRDIHGLIANVVGDSSFL